MQLSLPFRRRTESPTTEVEELEDQGVTSTSSRGYTPSKRELGKATPKRKEGGRRFEPAPKDRREAAKRQREKQKELREKQRLQRAEMRQGMLAGKEEFLPARDKGPERSLVRDTVDSRRNLASFFLPGALVVIVGSSRAMPAAVQVGTTLFWIILSASIVIDSYLLTRKVRKLLLARFPKAVKQPRSHYTYAIFRSLQIRRLRMPAPKVKIGEAL